MENSEIEKAILEAGMVGYSAGYDAAILAMEGFYRILVAAEDQQRGEILLIAITALKTGRVAIPAQPIGETLQ